MVNGRSPAAAAVFMPYRQRVAREGASLVDGTRGCYEVHDLTSPPVGPDRQTAADDLAQARHVGRDAKTLLRPTVGEPKTRHDLVEDQDGFVRARDLPKPF